MTAHPITDPALRRAARLPGGVWTCPQCGALNLAQERLCHEC